MSVNPVACFWLDDVSLTLVNGYCAIQRLSLHVLIYGERPDNPYSALHLLLSPVIISCHGDVRSAPIAPSNINSRSLLTHQSFSITYVAILSLTEYLPGSKSARTIGKAAATTVPLGVGEMEPDSRCCECQSEVVQVMRDVHWLKPGSDRLMGEPPLPQGRDAIHCATKKIVPE